eukprot:SAG11_NODE_138_length_15111_cov_11.388289_15_plen_63_part_00
MVILLRADAKLTENWEYLDKNGDGLLSRCVHWWCRRDVAHSAAVILLCQSITRDAITAWHGI